MEKNLIRRILSMALSIAMVFSMLPTALAAEDTCEHHIHDESCGYSEGTSGSDCTHSHDEACGYTESVEGSCAHTHDEACGYSEAVPGTPCGYECEVCAEEAAACAAPVVAEDTTIYYDNSASGWAQVFVNWANPQTNANEVKEIFDTDGDGLYEALIYGQTPSASFGPSSDLTEHPLWLGMGGEAIVAGEVYRYVPETSEEKDPTTPSGPVVAEDTTIYYDNSASGWAQVFVNWANPQTNANEVKEIFDTDGDGIYEALIYGQTPSASFGPSSDLTEHPLWLGMGGEAIVAGGTYRYVPETEEPEIPENGVTVIVPEDFPDQEAAQELVENTAVADFTVELPDGVTLVIEIQEIASESETLTLTFDVTPEDAEGNQVSLDAPITFRLPLPASVTESYAKIYHEGEYLETVPVNEESGAKYVEITAQNFSAYSVEPTDEAPEVECTGAADCPAAEHDAGCLRLDVQIFDSVYDAAVYLRDGIVSRSFERDTGSSVTATIYLSEAAVAEYSNDENEIWEKLYQEINAHTGDPTGGDYLRLNGTVLDCTISSGDGGWELTLNCVYGTSHAQEAELDKAILSLLQELDIYNSSDYQKVRAIYDWMCLNITYDYSKTKYKAYDAMCNKSAICQGYGSLFLRLCLEVGVDCRYCGGLASGEAHGWNIVQVDGEWYFVDTTWGAGLVEGEPDYYYLLKGIDGFGDHTIVASRWESEIGDYCEVSSEDYPIPEKSIIRSSGTIGTISYTLSKSGVLTISGSGSIERYWELNSIAEVIINEGITSIGENTFFGRSMASISLPDSLITLRSGALPNVRRIHLPKNLQFIEPRAINDPNTSISIATENAYFQIIDNYLLTKDGKTLVRCAAYNDEGERIWEYHVPMGVETIGARAFSQVDGSESKPVKIVLPETVKYIEEYAFANCTYVDVQLTDNIVSISDGAFDSCYGITSFYIGRNVEYIGESALGSGNLETIEVHPSNQYFTCVDGVLFNKQMTELIRYPIARRDRAYVIPEGVRRIATGAFLINHTDAILEEVSFPDSLLEIGQSAFGEQCNILSLELPPNLELIGDGAFRYLPKLTKITIPDSVREIGRRAFAHNRATEIVIGSGVEVIGYGAFIADGYSANGSNSEIKVYFKGVPPKIKASEDVSSGVQIFFGYDQIHSEFATLYYPYEYREYWAPNGEGYWKPEAPKNEWNRYKIKTFLEKGDCCYEVEVIEPTCTEQGYTSFTCTKCGDHYVDEYKDALSHSLGNYWFVDTDPTCTEPGILYKECSRCNGIVTKDSPPKGHRYTSAVVAPTCEDQGYTTYTCSRCGDSYVDNYVDALDHDMSDWIVDEAATCTAPGSKHKQCSRCSHSETNTIAAKGHIEVVDKKVEATCTETGLTEGKHCAVCAETISAQEIIPALGHKAETILGSDATCTEPGLTDGSKCSVCGEILATQEVIPATGHGYSEVVTAPTCKEEGYTTYTCGCGDSYVDDYVPALGHDMGPWTAIDEEMEQRQCSRCDHAQTRRIGGNILVLPDEEFKNHDTVWIDGQPVSVEGEGEERYVDLPTGEETMLVAYTWHIGDEADIHTKYPTGMKVYRIVSDENGFTAEYIPEMDNLLQYSGASIRIVGVKGIRMITSITKGNKSALTGEGLAGYTLEEYGTALCWATDLAPGEDLVLGKEYTRSNYAYKKGVADPIFAQTADLIQYTNVLVGFSDDQCIPDIVMRPYIILSDAEGNQVTLYGGSIHRSIGYIAYQNRNVFQPGNASYDYVWGIIHHVYGDQFDEDYKG